MALANKESLVAGGDWVMDLAGENRLIPVDSEHSAIFQCLEGRAAAEVRGVLLTASGGPFFSFEKARLVEVGPEDALKHPTWRMGRKITIDSATMMNKGLEVIEAHHLFGVPYDERAGRRPPPVGRARRRALRGRLCGPARSTSRHEAPHSLRRPLP